MYSIINLTDKTRVSMDFRIIPFSKFKNLNLSSVTSKSKFTIDDYYILV